MSRSLRRRLTVGLLVALAGLAVVACGGDDGPSAPGSASGDAGADRGTTGEPVTLRLGLFPNVTHATALVGVEQGIFAEELGPGVRLDTQGFNAGPAAIEALFGGALDATYIGPNPAINGYVKSRGDALRIVSGATSGGAFLVVRPDIDSSAELKGRKLATPQLGGTQDVALRSWLDRQGMRTDTSGGGDVSILPQENAQTLDAFKTGAIDGAWVPEPWATRLIQEGGAKVLVDERDLWPGGQYVTTHLIVAREFLDEHPEVVRRLLEGQVAANDVVNGQPAEAQRAANDRIEELTGKRIPDRVIASAWSNLTFTNDPVAASLRASAEAAESIGLLDLGGVELGGIYDLGPLNEVLGAAGQPRVGQL
jgi:NitT/TauT family transport system substrate-binding protein